MQAHPVDVANEFVHWRSEQIRAAQEFKAVNDQKAIAQLAVKKMMRELDTTELVLDDGRKLVWVDETGEIKLIEKE